MPSYFGVLRKRSVLYILLSVIFFFMLSSCSSQNNSEPKTEKSSLSDDLKGEPLVLSILPIERASYMYERFLPLKYHLEGAIKRPVVIEVAKDYESAIQKIGNGQVHIACLDPASYAKVRARYKNRVIPLVKVVSEEGATPRSVLVAKEGSRIENITDLKGKRLALGSENSSFSYLIPVAMLNDVGIKLTDFETVNFLEQQDRVALSVLIGDHDAGDMSESVARKYMQDGLKIIKTSDAIPQFVICVSDKLPLNIREQIKKSLIPTIADKLRLILCFCAKINPERSAGICLRPRKSKKR